MTQNEISKRLLKNIPSYERESLIINEILNSISEEFESVEQKEIEKNNEFFIDTAVKALALHARDLGITIENFLTSKEKRELVVAYYRAILEQTNDETIKNVASSFTGGTIEIKSTTKEGVFGIAFTDIYGTPTNIENLRKALDVIIPAHLQFIFEYSYLLVRDVSKMSLIELEKTPLDLFAGG